MAASGGDYIPGTRQRPVQMAVLVKFKNLTSDHKKAGRYPIRVYVGPTKNLLQDDRETPSKIRRHNLPAGYISIPGAKEH